MNLMDAILRWMGRWSFGSFFAHYDLQNRLPPGQDSVVNTCATATCRGE